MVERIGDVLGAEQAPQASETLGDTAGVSPSLR
jgi:hypothetical protein